MSAEILRNVYYNLKHPAGYGSVSKLVKATGLSPMKVKTWLKKQPTYTLHRQARRNYPTRQYIVHDIDEQWQADLADVSLLARENGGYRFILTVIDIFSRFAWSRPLKTKRGEEVAAAFKDIFAEGRIPKRIQTDQGKEFENRHVRSLFEQHDVELFSVKSAYKAAMVERFNRTLKHKIWRYLTSTNQRNWLSVLQDAVHSYNHSTHRMINRKPAEVTQEDVGDMREEYLQPRPKGDDKFRVGDKVRISKVKSVFEKGYLPNWTEEIFTIAEVNRKYNPITYKLKDANGEVIEGSFYHYEIQDVTAPEQYLVEKVIRQERRGREVWCLVKWYGYPASMNSWVRQRDINRVENRQQV